LTQTDSAKEKVKIVPMDADTIDQIIHNYQGDADSLIQVLLEIQRESRWLPGDVLEKVSEGLQLPLGKVQNVASFYKAFRLIPRARHEIHICMGTACYVRGAPRIVDAVQAMLGIKPGETDEDLRFSLETVNCLGVSTPGPVMVVDGTYYGKMTPSMAEKILKNYD
jgi:NADH-quinone oxidoreductase subunit E